MQPRRAADFDLIRCCLAGDDVADQVGHQLCRDQFADQGRYLHQHADLTQRPTAKALPERKREKTAKAIEKPKIVRRNGLMFDIPQLGEALAIAKAAEASAAKAPREKVVRVKVKTDPRLVAAARELRDRYLEHVNENVVASAGKYDVSRIIGERVFVEVVAPALPVAPARLLPAA